MAFRGRNRRYYKITEQGTAQLNLYQSEWKNYVSRISAVLSGHYPAQARKEEEG